MRKITEAVCEELSRLIQCVHDFNAGGAIQVGSHLYTLSLVLYLNMFVKINSRKNVSQML